MRARMLDHVNRKWWTLGAVAFGLFMIMLDNTVVNVALPSIQRDLGIGLSELEWTVNAYTLTFAVFLLTGAALGGLPGGTHEDRVATGRPGVGDGKSLRGGTPWGGGVAARARTWATRWRMRLLVCRGIHPLA